MVVIALAAACVSAQFSSVTTLCGELAFTPGVSKAYYTAAVSEISEFEYRLIANDGLPLGYKELYDFDEDDETGTNYDCYVETTIDDTTCPNTYLAGGYVQPTFPAREIKFGFEACATSSRPAVTSSNITLQLWYRPTPSSDLTLKGTCSMPTEAEPTTFCARDTASSVSALIAVLAALIVTSMM